MPSPVDICNMALSHIGSDAIVSSIEPPDGGVEAGHCARFYNLARTAMLELGNWSFARTRAQLAEVTNTSTAYEFAYALPSDCLRAQRVLRLSSNSIFTIESFEINESSSADFVIEGQVLRTNEPEAVLLYTTDVVDSTQFTPSYVSALGYMLASYVAGPIVKGNEGAKLGDAMRERAMAEARASDANDGNASSSTTAAFVPGQIVARR